MTEPTVQAFGEELFVTWAGQLSVQFSHFQERFGVLQAEVSILGPNLGELAWGQVALISSESRGKFTKRLDAPVPVLFECACREAVRAYRQPPAWQPIVPKHRASEALWFWTDWVLAGQTNVLYGDGDSGKSLLALTLAVCALTGRLLADTWPIARLDSVLYVDYEQDAEAHGARLACLLEAMEIAPSSLTGLYHLRGTRPFAELAPLVRAEVQRRKVGCVILDSLGAACGGEPESASANVAVLNGLFNLGPAVTRIVLAHISHAMQRVNGPRKAFGSVYVRNLPRANVEVRRVDSGGALALTLRVDKNNDQVGGPPAPIGLALELTPGQSAIRWRPATPAGRSVQPYAPRPGTVTEQVLVACPWSAEGAQSAVTIASRADCTPDTARKLLNRLYDEHLVDKVAGKEPLWYRIVSERDIPDTSVTDMDL